MNKERLTAFSDGVIAIIITIMVLELKVPQGAGWDALARLVPTFLSYVLSFVFVAIYWNNHHHLLHACRHVTAAILWANTHLLFWLSLIPFTTGWMGENHWAELPVAVYGVSMLMPALAGAGPAYREGVRFPARGRGVSGHTRAGSDRQRQRPLVSPSNGSRSSTAGYASLQGMAPWIVTPDGAIARTDHQGAGDSSG